MSLFLFFLLFCSMIRLQNQIFEQHLHNEETCCWHPEVIFFFFDRVLKIAGLSGFQLHICTTCWTCSVMQNSDISCFPLPRHLRNVLSQNTVSESCLAPRLVHYTRTSDIDGTGMVEKRFTLSGASSVPNLRLMKPLRGWNVSPSFFSHLCLMFWNKFFNFWTYTILNAEQGNSVRSIVFLTENCTCWS